MVVFFAFYSLTLEVTLLDFYRVVYLPNDAGKSPSQTVEAMNQKILGLGAVKSTSMHSIECDVYQSMVPQGSGQNIS